MIFWGKLFLGKPFLERKGFPPKPPSPRTSGDPAGEAGRFSAGSPESFRGKGFSKRGHMEAIISHISTDFDGLASMVAAKKLYPQAKLFFPGPPEGAVKKFLNLYKDFVEVEIPRHIDKLPIHRLIIVDCRNPGRLGDFGHLVNNPQIELHIYDHHPPSQEDIKGDLNAVSYTHLTLPTIYSV